MQDRKWVFKQKHSIPPVGIGLHAALTALSLLFSPPSFDSAIGGAAGTPGGNRGNLRAGFVQCIIEGDYYFAKGPEISAGEIMKGGSAYKAILGDVIKTRNF